MTPKASAKVSKGNKTKSLGTETRDDETLGDETLGDEPLQDDPKQVNASSVNKKKKDSIVLFIDTREAKVLEILEKTAPSKFERRQLPVGDFLFVHRSHTSSDPIENPAEASERPVLVLERKTPSDLNSSILTGRHKEQRQRLATFMKTEHDNGNKAFECGYIIEGLGVGGRQDPAVNKRVSGALENMSLRDAFVVLPTSHAQGTADMLLSLLKKLNDPQWQGSKRFRFEPCDEVTEATQTGGGSVRVVTDGDETIAAVHTRKNKIAGNCFYHMLLVVPGVGERLAKELSDLYVSPERFLTYLRSDGIESLAQVKVSGRRVGMKVAQKIFDAFTLGTVTV